jgi:hypothetical protein
VIQLALRLISETRINAEKRRSDFVFQIGVYLRESAANYLLGLPGLVFLCPSPLRGGASFGVGSGGCADVTPWGSRSLLLVP